MWKLLWKSIHEHTKVIFTIQYIWKSTNARDLQLVTQPKHITRGSGIENAEEFC